MLVGSIIGYHAADRVYRIRDRISDYLIDRVSEFLGSGFEASSISVLPWAVSIKDARIRLREMPVTVTISRIRIGFNLFDLLAHRLNPLYGTDEIYLDRPRFTWMLNGSAGHETKLPFDEIPVFTFNDLPEIMVNIDRGSFVITRRDDSIVLAEDISGLLDARQKDALVLHVKGKILSDVDNTQLSGYLNRHNDSYTMTFASDGVDLTRGNLALLTGDITPVGGRLSLTVDALQKDNHVSIDGGFSLTGGAFDIQQLNTGIRNITVRGALNEREIVLDDMTGMVWGVTPEMSGRLTLGQSPRLEFNLTAQDFEVSRLITDLFPDFEDAPTGEMDINARLEGPLRDIAISADFSADTLTFRGQRTRNLTAAFALNNREVAIKRSSFSYNGMNLGLSGLYNFENETQHTFKTHLNVAGKSNTADRYEISLSGTKNPTKDQAKADYTLTRFQAGENERERVTGELSLDDTRLTATLKHKKLSVYADFADIYDDPFIRADIAMNDFSPGLLFGGAYNDLVVSGSSKIEGTQQSLDITGNAGVVYGEHYRGDISAVAGIEDVFGENRRYEIDADISNLFVWYSSPMEMRCVVRGDNLGTHAEAHYPGGVDLMVWVSGSNDRIDGRCYLNDFPLEDIIDIARKEEFSHRGRISGELNIDGTLTYPTFVSEGMVKVEDLKIGGLDLLLGTTKVSGSFRELHFNDTTAYRNSIRIGRGSGVWILGTPLYVNMVGEKVNMAAITDLIDENRRTDGTADFEVDMEFTRKYATINGHAEVVDGHFIDIPFDIARATLSGGSDGFLLGDMYVEQEGVYTCEGEATSGFFWKDRTEEPGLKMNLYAQGDLLRILPSLTGAVTEAHGDAQANIVLGGTWQDPIAVGGGLVVSNGSVKPSFLVDEVTDIRAVLSIDGERQTEDGLQPVYVRLGTGTVLDRKIIVSNVHPFQDRWESVYSDGLISVVNERANLDFGVFAVKIDNPEGRDSWVDLHIPGFMKDRDSGRFQLSGHKTDEVIVGAGEGDDGLTPYISGVVNVMAGDITYPLLKVESEDGEQSDTAFLEEMFWNLDINAGSSVYYLKEENRKWGELFGATVSRILLRLEDESGFQVRGRLSDDSFRVNGQARSRSGTVSFYGAEFNVEWVDFEVDTNRTGKPSILTGRANTVVYDSTGVPTEIHLNATTTEDDASAIRRRAPGRADALPATFEEEEFDYRFFVAGLGTVVVEFSSNNPSDDSQRKILAKLGISSENFGDAAERAVTSGFDTYYTSLWFRPFETAVKRYTKIDVVRFTPSLVGNLMRSQFGFREHFGVETKYVPFDRSRIMLGEYFSDKWFVSYRGQYGLSRDYLNRTERGFFHELGLQYNMERNTRLQFNYLYDDVIEETDRRIEIRHDFEF